MTVHSNGYNCLRHSILSLTATVHKSQNIFTLLPQCPVYVITYAHLDKPVMVADDNAVAVSVHPDVVLDECPLLPGPCEAALVEDKGHIEPAGLSMICFQLAFNLAYQLRMSGKEANIYPTESENPGMSGSFKCGELGD